ncbi:MAG: YceI family protein [Bacteroidota bacterium]
METLTKTIWAIDPTHSEAGFKVRHLVISTVNGKFNEFEGSVETEEDNFEGAEINFAAKIDSISTGVADRDAHLKSDDFFNAAEYPELKFQSTSFTKLNDDEYALKGDLTIRDNTKPVELKVIYGGTVSDPYGNTKAGFEISGKINRKEFGLKWDDVTEAGSVVVSEEIKLDLNIQLVKQ